MLQEACSPSISSAIFHLPAALLPASLLVPIHQLLAHQNYVYLSLNNCGHKKGRLDRRRLVRGGGSWVTGASPLSRVSVETFPYSEVWRAACSWGGVF